MTTTVGKARIDIEVDGSGISKSLEAAMDRALAAVSKSADAAFGKVEKDAASAGDEIGSGIGDGAKAAERALSSIGTDGIDNISKAASDAADAVSKSSSDAADSLSDVGAAGAEAGATASGAMASSMADVTSAAATAGARAADSLSGVGGAASEAGATASGAMAGSMADVSSSAASAFSAVSASAADAAGGVAASAADMSASMSGALSSIQGAAAGAVGAVGGAGGGLGNLARKAGPAAAALAGVAGAGATVKAGFDKLTSIEDTTASLGIILGDLDQATSLMDKLQEDNLTTPYMFDAYAGAGKTLAAFGADLEGIPEQVRALGEAAAASGGGQAVFDSMARASGQAMATGKMSLDTINQLAVGGVQGLQILANHFDVPTSEMQKMISQGMVPAQEGMDILTQGILEGSDGIAGATQSMSGVMQEMSETTSGSMTNLLAGFTNLASAGIQPLLPAIQALADGMTKLSYFIIDVVNGDLDGWMGTVLDIAKPLSITIGALTAAVAALVVQQKIAAAGGFLKWLGSFNAITKVSTAVQAAFNAVMAANPIVLVTLAIAALVAGLAYFFTKTETGQRIWDAFMDKLSAGADWLKNTLGPVWDGITAAWGKAMDWISNAWEGITSLFSGDFTSALGDAFGIGEDSPIVGFFLTIRDTVGEVFGWIGTKLGEFGAGLGQFYATWIEPQVVAWQTAMSLLGDAVVWFVDTLVMPYLDVLGSAWSLVFTTVISPVIDGFKLSLDLLWQGAQFAFDLIMVGWDFLGSQLQNVWNNLVRPIWDLFMSVVGLVADVLTGNFSNIGNRFGELGDRLAGVVQGAIQYAMDTFRNIVDALGGTWSAFRDLVSGVIDAVIGYIGRMVDNIREIPGQVRGFFSDAGTWLLDAGRNVVQGFINGVKSLAGAIGQAFLDTLPGWIKDPFKKALGIASPSKVFAGYGENIGEGLIEGVSGMSAQVSSVTRGLAEDAAEAAAGVRVGVDMQVAQPVGQMAVGAVSQMAAGALGAPGVGESMGQEGPGRGEASGGLAAMLDPASAEGAVEASSLVGGAFAEAGENMAAVKTDLIDPAMAGMQQGVLDYAFNTQEQMANVVVPAMYAAGQGITDAKMGLFDPAHAGMQAALNNTALTTQTAMLGTALPAMQQAGAGIMAVQTGTVDPALANMRGAVGATQSAFAAGASGINAEWNRIRAGTADPARFVISTVFNDGIVGMWNSASELIGTDKMSPYPLRFSTGGHVRGPGGPTGDMIPAWLSDNEYVLKASTVKKIGVSTLNALNDGAFTIAPGAIKNQADVQAMKMDKTISRMARGYASGGVVKGDPIWNRFKRAHDFAMRWDGRPYVWGGSLGPDGGTDCSGWVSSIADVVHGGSGLLRQWATGSFPGGGGSQGASGPQGFVAGLGAGLSAGVSTVHTAGTLGGVPGLPTVNVESGGSHGNVRYGGPSVGADHSQFPSQYHLSFPGLGMFRSGGGGGGNSIASLVAAVVGPEQDKIREAIAGYSAPGLAGTLPDNIGGRMMEATENAIHEMMMEFGGDPGGEGAERWRPLAIRAMAMTGFDPSNKAQVDAMIAQIASESGGNPGILQQVQDVNSGGNEAMGLLQVIPGTFAAHRDPSLPDDRTHPLANMVAALNYYRSRYGHDLTTMWGHGHGYDDGGLAAGVGVMPKYTIKPERVLNPEQTKAFEAWMAAGQDVSAINELVKSLQRVQLDHPDAMSKDVANRVQAWMAESVEANDLRALLAALESGIEWERVTEGMKRSAEAWANGEWVEVADGKRLATPEEMGQQVGENFLEELADEFGGLIGLKGLYKGRDIVGESGLIDLPKAEAAEIVPQVASTEVVPSAGESVKDATETGTGTITKEEQAVNITINVNGVSDPMAVKDLVMTDLKRGLATATGTGRSQ